MINVIMILPRYLPIIGGAEVQCDRLIKALKNIDDINVCGVITRRVQRSLCRQEFINGVLVKRLPPLGTGIISEYIFCIFLFFYLLFNSKKYDVIHCHASSIFGIIVSLVGGITGKKVFVKVSTNGEVAAMQNGRIKKAIVSFSSKYCTYIALNNEGYHEVQSCIPEANVIMIPNGIDFNISTTEEKYTLRRELEKQFGKDVFICLFIGRMVTRKGVKDLLSAAELLLKKNEHNYCFLLVGDGNLQRDAESLSSFFSNERIIMVGRKNNVIPYVNACDVFISPSYNEGLPNTVLEALFCGKKCILSDIKPHVELQSEHPSHIKTFKVKDVNMLADMIAGESNLHAESQSEGNVLISKYSIRNVALKYSSLYRE